MNFLIDPNDIIDFNRTSEELELFWLFCLVVAGKTAKTQARLLNGFLESLPTPYGWRDEQDSPFERISLAEWRGELLDRLKESRLGQFNRLHRAFTGSLTLNLRSCTLDDLEAIHGVGPKTARMFLMMSRPAQRFAALDTHVLKHLRAHGIDAPVATPSAGARYRALEEAFLGLADQSGMPVADYDLMVWRRYSGKESA